MARIRAMRFWHDSRTPEPRLLTTDYELPRLTHEERRLLCRRALALDTEAAAEIAVAEHSADEGFALLDQMEAEDDARGKGR